MSTGGLIRSVIRGNGSGGAAALPSIKTVWVSQNNSAQAPSAVNTPITIDWGTPTVNTGEVSVAAGVITFNQGGVYSPIISLQVGRTSNPGVATIVVRVLLNGSQVGDSSFFTFDSTSDNILFTNSTPITVNATDAFQLELARDGSGNNDGGLYPLTPDAGLTGWNVASSAELNIVKWFS